MFNQIDDEQLIHSWIEFNKIELIHQEPTKEELDKSWERWQKMSKRKKERSDEKSIELFGMTNEQHHTVLELLYI